MIVVKSKAVGTVTHYFDRIGVAALKLASPLTVGDTVKIAGHGSEFTQEVTSMQIDHRPVEKAKPGQDVALKVDQAVEKGDALEKIK